MLDIQLETHRVWCRKDPLLLDVVDGSALASLPNALQLCMILDERFVHWNASQRRAARAEELMPTAFSKTRHRHEHVHEHYDCERARVK